MSWTRWPDAKGTSLCRGYVMDQVARREGDNFVSKVLHFTGAKWLHFTVSFRDRNSDGLELCRECILRGPSGFSSR